MGLTNIDDFKSIVLENRPLLDVRSPIEFVEGAFLGATNLPLLSDEERRLIGIRYKEAGNSKAVKLGEELVGPYKDERVSKWMAYIKENPDAYLYCFRGGQRSKISQEWILDAGVNIPRLKGGYKAFRTYLMQKAEEVSQQLDTFIIGGRTGSGKTLVLKEFENIIDLEGLANHRGSAFGKQLEEQPSQIDFENSLSYKLIQHDNKKPLILEHESKNVGRLYIPTKIYENLMHGKLIVLETPIQQRVDITYDEYVLKAISKYENLYKEEGMARWFEDANNALDKIQKRLGSKRYLYLKNIFKDAYQCDDIEANKVWIQYLLEDYYDKMYDYQIEKTSIPIVFRGNFDEVRAYLNSIEIIV